MRITDIEQKNKKTTKNKLGCKYAYRNFLFDEVKYNRKILKKT